MNIRQFNKLYADPANKVLLKKALTSATNVGEALIPQDLEQIITNTIIRLVPEIAVPVLRQTAGKLHEFNRISALPAAGSAMGESSTTPTRNSTYQRANVTLKIMKRKGAVTGFLKDTAREYINASSAELENHLQSFGNDMANYLLYGNAGADSYTYSGLDRFISTNRTNKTRGGVVPTTLKELDDLIDANISKGGSAHRKVFVMSPQLLSTFSRLYTTVRDNRDAIRGSDVIEVPGGWRLDTYRKIPIIESTSTRPISTMGTVTTAHAGGGGAIPNATRYFRVAPVTWNGEQLASAAASDTSSSSDTITLSFTAIANALYYKVYVGTTANNTTLKKIVSAFTYDGTGTPTAAITSIVFTSDPSTADATSVPAHMQSDVPLIATGGIAPEYLFLWDLDEIQGLGKFVYTNTGGSRFTGLATVEELARTDDNFPFLIKSYAALVDAFEATCCVVRGLRAE